VAASDLVGDEEADVVTCTLVGAARVTETHDDGRPHIGFSGRLLIGPLLT